MSAVLSLFLDRDGVINELLPMNYVTTWQEFIFKKDVLKELAKLSIIFDHLFIVTNQQGVGKGLMTQGNLDDIHNKMLEKIHTAGGKITKIYACTHLEEAQCDCRKPKTGMLKFAFDEYPELNAHQSFLVGDSSSDIEMADTFGIPSAGMLHIYNKHSIWKPQPQYFINDLTDLRTKVLPLILEKNKA